MGVLTIVDQDSFQTAPVTWLTTTSLRDGQSIIVVVRSANLRFDRGAINHNVTVIDLPAGSVRLFTPSVNPPKPNGLQIANPILRGLPHRPDLHPLGTFFQVDFS
jgi:hypothetical protein